MMLFLYLLIFYLLPLNLFSNNGLENANDWNRKHYETGQEGETKSDERKGNRSRKLIAFKTGVPQVDAIVNVALTAYWTCIQIGNWWSSKKELESVFNDPDPIIWYNKPESDLKIMQIEPYDPYDPCSYLRKRQISDLKPQAPAKASNVAEQTVSNPKIHFPLDLPLLSEEQKQQQQKCCEQDFHDYQQYQQDLQGWCNQLDPNELPDRYKRNTPSTKGKAYDRSFSLPEDLKKELEQHGIDAKKWHRMCCNDVQAFIHDDSLQLLRQATGPFKSSFLNDCRSDLIQTLEAGRAFNEQGYCLKASKVNNFCAALMDYGEVVVDGVATGICEAVNFAWEHKEAFAIGGIGAAAIAGYPVAVTALLVANVVPVSWEIGRGLGEWICQDYPALEQRLDRALGSFVVKKREIDSGQRGLKECLHDVAHSGGRLGTDYLLARSASAIVRKAVQQSGRLIRKIGKERYYLAVSDGQVIEAGNGINDQGYFEKTNDSNGLGKSINQVVGCKVDLKNLNFTKTAASRMEKPGRFVPIQTIKEVIENPLYSIVDPKGTSEAKMFYSRMFKNGKEYNIEVLYDEKSNTILHCLYSSEDLGPLSPIL